MTSRPSLRLASPDGGSRLERVDWLRVSWWAVLALIVFIATLPLDFSAQVWLSGLIAGLLIVLYHFRLRGAPRTFFLFVAAFLSVRYLIWRTVATLSYPDPMSFVVGALLYAAEVYAIVIFLSGLFVNLRPLDRKPVPMPTDPAKLRTVDVLIPTYNEPLQILETTVWAAVQMRYPRDKLNVYVLDDGATREKLEDPDPANAAFARRRQRELRELCENSGAHYLSRDRNLNAKAGNVNAALARSSGELILMLDADHVPTADFLERTVGFFELDPKLFLVQTPHFFLNPNPIEKNLQTFEQMPADSEMFFFEVQRGLDFWNGTFFCGSAALIRRKPLEDVGGIATHTVTEDAETALELHARGYNSVYFARPMIAGLSPETFRSYISQRTRWAQGMVQVFLLKNPLFRPGLTLAQRICYFNCCIFWFFSYARIIFLIAPAVFLVFGLQIYNARPKEILVYALPHVIAIVLVSEVLFGRVRWILVSELYEMMQSVFGFVTLTQVLLHPRHAVWRVTPKAESLDEDVISPLAAPFYVLSFVMLFALAAGIHRLIYEQAIRDVVLVTLVWQIVNTILLLAAVGALLEKRQRRRHPRVPFTLAAELLLDDRSIPCELFEISLSGARIRVAERHAREARDAGAGMGRPLRVGADLRVRVANRALGRQSEIGMRVRHADRAGDWIMLGSEFRWRSPKEVGETVALLYGDSERWIDFLSKRERDIGVARGMGFIVALAVRHFTRHVVAMTRFAFEAIGAAIVLVIGRASLALGRLVRLPGRA
jgi:cellulose synthase (UDP-forming)